MEAIRQEVIGMGAADFIAKPFNSEQLLVKIRRVLGEE
jgi:DNA-binding response OmpR family regulator